MSSPPSTLGKYQIIREIARSNDIVYEAYDPLMNRRVAVKELAVPNGSTTQQRDERLKRFLREAKAAGSLAHPNIVTIYEVGEDGGRHYLVMEYLDGHTLRNELDTHGSLSPDRAVEIAEAILRGLEYAHQNGVIHRDIKPENIQILSDGRIKLTDFGIARLTFEPNLTMDGQVFGTPSYMSPEQVVGRDIDARSDVFSVGVVLYEMIAGQKPFPGDSVVAITYAIMNKEPDQPPQANFAIWQVVSKALDKSPTLRHSSASEMLSALANAKHSSQNMVMDSYGPPPVQTTSAYPVPPPPAGMQSNPFMPQQPPVNPYISQQPYSQSPQAPIQYPYNPYGQQQGPPPGALSPQPYTNPYPQLPPNVPVNVYYPPPPRKPLLKPDQKAVIQKILIVTLVLGTVFLLVVVLLMFFTGQIKSPDAQSSANHVVRNETSGTSQPVAEGGTSIESADEQEGLDLMNQADTNAASPEGATMFLSQAVLKFQQAEDVYNQAGDQSGAQRSANEEAECHLKKATLVGSSDRSAARQELYLAREKASPDSKTYQDILAQIEKFS